MTLELYVFPPSPRAFKVLSVANHLEIPYQLRLVDLRKGEQRTPQYAGMNPNLRMPTLKDGDFVVWESNAIQQYLALQRPEAGLLPREERARLDVTRWQFWDLAHWDPACSIYIFEHLVKPAFLGIDEPDAAALARGEEMFHRAARVLDEQLAAHPYVAGPALTLADFAIGAPLTVAQPARMPLQPYERIRRWYGTLGSLPAWKKTLEQSATMP
jgi:glutathione S-transferase